MVKCKELALGPPFKRMLEVCVLMEKCVIVRMVRLNSSLRLSEQLEGFLSKLQQDPGYATIEHIDDLNTKDLVICSTAFMLSLVYIIVLFLYSLKKIVSNIFLLM